MRQNLAWRRLLVGRKKISVLTEFKKIREKWSPKHIQLQRKQFLSDVFYFEKLSFLFLSNWLGKYYPPQGRFITLDIYLDGSRFVIYFHHCSLFNQSMKIKLTKTKGYFCSRAKIHQCEIVGPRFSSSVSNISLTFVSYVPARITTFENI